MQILEKINPQPILELIAVELMLNGMDRQHDLNSPKKMEKNPTI